MNAAGLAVMREEPFDINYPGAWVTRSTLIKRLKDYMISDTTNKLSYAIMAGNSKGDVMT